VTAYSPNYTIEINGIDYTNDSIGEVTITVGRNDIFDTTLPGYTLIELVNLIGTSPVIDILDRIVIKTTDSSANDITLFTGEVTSVNNQIVGAGATSIINSLIITGVGSLAKLVRKNAGAIAYPQELDGERIERILQDALFTAWDDLSGTLEWDDVDASETWETFGVQGIDIIDDGRYEIIARSAEVANANDLARDTEISGLGYLYETSSGDIGYAGAERRTSNIANNSIALDAGILNAQMQTSLSTQDVINSVIVQYDDGSSEVQAINDQSVDDYGLIETIFRTLLIEQADAEEQALRYVGLRGIPQMNLESITLNLVNNNIDNDTRDALLGLNMDTLLVISNMPEGIVSSEFFEGFVEGWTWTLSKNSLELEISVSNAIYSAFEVQFEDYNPTTQWQNLANDLQWLDLAIG
jgi:hypothetical protein